MQVSVWAVRRLFRRWRLHGRMCLMQRRKQRSYSFEVKKLVVDRFISGATAMDLCAEFDLSSAAMVHKWVGEWRRGGDQALMPKRRGRPSKPVEALSEQEALRQENRVLKAENAYLKKLRDLRE